MLYGKSALSEGMIAAGCSGALSIKRLGGGRPRGRRYAPHVIPQRNVSNCSSRTRRSAVLFAVLTGMRIGEILARIWAQLSTRMHMLSRPRNAALSNEWQEVCSQMLSSHQAAPKVNMSTDSE